MFKVIIIVLGFFLLGVFTYDCSSGWETNFPTSLWCPDEKKSCHYVDNANQYSCKLDTQYYDFREGPNYGGFSGFEHYGTRPCADDWLQTCSQSTCCTNTTVPSKTGYVFGKYFSNRSLSLSNEYIYIFIYIIYFSPLANTQNI